MEFHVYRALEVARLTEAMVDWLHSQEDAAGSCAQAPTVRAMFPALPALKDEYRIPLDKMTDHRKSVSAQVIETGACDGFKPPNFLLTPLHVDNVHEYDTRIRNLAACGRLKFYFDQPPVPVEPTRDPEKPRATIGGTGRLLETDWRTAAGEGYAE